jgi:hypothetical protein
MKRAIWQAVCCLAVWGLGLTLNLAQAEQTPAEHFDKEVAPILIRSCLNCHAGLDPQGGLDLTTAAGLARGGENGPVWQRDQLEESRLWQVLREGEMPPNKPLPEADREVLLRWLQQGAVWGTAPLDPFRFSTANRAGYDWWSLLPLSDPVPPPQGSDWARDPLDRFIAAKLAAHQLTPAAPASRRTLIRRLSYDLLGLPPQPTEIEEFLANDSPTAYEELVDRYLASPHLGIRWGRHWLDVARFGESQGFERDKLRENSWPYRDWVIDALNADLPYDEFARQQLAGDVLPGRDLPGAVATGFLVAGPWDEVGQLQQSAAMKAVVRQDEYEDYLSTIGQAFLGLTIHCARCHDHKFDPISQREYYQLAAAIAGVRHGSRELLTEAQQQQQALLKQALGTIQRELQGLEQGARDRVLAGRSLNPGVPAPIARWNFENDLLDEFSSLPAQPQGGKTPLQDGAVILGQQGGYLVTAPLSRDLQEKTLEAWVQLDRLDQGGGGVISLQSLDGQIFDAIVYGEREPGRWIAGSNGFVRTRDVNGPAEQEAHARPVHIAISYAADGLITLYREGELYGSPYQSQGPVRFKAGEAQVLFGLRHKPAGGNRHLSGRVAAAQLYDRALSAAEIAASAAQGPTGISREQLLAALSETERTHHARLTREISRIESELAGIRPLSAYVVAPRAPEPMHLLLRGNPQSPAEEVLPGGIAAVCADAVDFGLSRDATDAERRQALANWITAPNNPLFARVMVNRIWQHLFGSGLVTTASDFGFNGGQPSHPDLLDYLARDFVRSGYSIKQLLRRIVLSASYQQSSTYNPVAAEIDRDNRWLWRMSPRRLEAEVLRDAMLAVSGELNPALGGPGFRDFDTFTSNSQFYVLKDLDSPDGHRRTIYRTAIRSGRHPLLDAFDCPDPSISSPNRAVTVTPLQALALQNNTFALRISTRLAERTRREAGENPDEQVRFIYRQAFGREPQPAEAPLLQQFVTEYGLPEFCRVIFNASEFLYLD